MNAFLMDVLLPVGVFLVMLISGTGIRAREVSSAKAFCRPLSICLGIQLVSGPAIALLLIGISEPVTFIALCLCVLSICPSGTLSTGYTFIAGGNVALSAVLSTSSTLMYAVVFPALAAIVSGFLGAVSLEDTLPVGDMFTDVLGYLVLPVILGVVIRDRFHDLVERNRSKLVALTGALTAAIVMFSAVIGWEALVGSFSDVFAMSVVFTLLSLGAGRVAASFVDPRDRSALTIECAVRNIPIAMVIASDIHEHVTITGFFVGFFIANALILVPYSLAQGRSLRRLSR